MDDSSNICSEGLTDASQPQLESLDTTRLKTHAQTQHFPTPEVNENPKISLEELPDSSQLHMDFLDTAWFKTHGQTQQFPTPEHLMSLCSPYKHPRPVKFEDLGLIVKFGKHVSITEAINLWAIRKVFRDDVPVPEVYGWRVFEERKPRIVFIYMQLVQGPTLEQRWPDLSWADKQTICSDLRAIVARLRSLQDNESQPVVGKRSVELVATSLNYIGTICHGPAEDYCVEKLPLLRPFCSRAEFHDWLSWLWRRMAPDPQSIDDPWRDLLPDNGPIVFTHSDLRQANIIVTATSPPEVVAIVDWQMSGWYPDYWEYCKAMFTTLYGGEWWGYIDQFLDPHPQALEAFDFYTDTLGKF